MSEIRRRSRTCVVAVGGSALCLFMSASAFGLPPRPDRGGANPPPSTGPINPPPADLALVAQSAHVVRVQFRCAHAADRHQLFRSLDEGSAQRVEAALTCQGHSGSGHDRSTQAETRYCYFVRGLNAAHSADSERACVETPVATPATPVAWLVGSETDSIEVLIRDQSTDESLFRIERRPAGPGAWTFVADLPATHTGPTGGELRHVDTGLNPATEYHYRVRAGYTSRAASHEVSWSGSVVLGRWTRPVVAANASGACAITPGVSTCRAAFSLSPRVSLMYYRNYPLDQARSSITRVVLVVHGTGRNAKGTYTNMRAAAAEAQVLGETLIVAPHFDEGNTGWLDGWKAGANNRFDAPGGGISSFTVADRLLMAMTDPARFPNVREVVVAGHSAGGQFTQRYATMSSIESQRPALKFRYVVANPSSYAYLNDQRPVNAGPGGINATFGTPRRCSSYNDYKYGLADREGYPGRLSAAAIRAQYPPRYVIYLLGGSDNDTNDPDLDTSCEANLQGFQRLVRGGFYYQHMMRFFPENRHRKVVVPGVAHSGYSMYNSDNGEAALFF